MKKISALILAIVMSVALALPATAETCDDILAFARLDASGLGTAHGTAVVLWEGAVQAVAIDSTIVGPLVDQVWHFASGDVSVTETPHPVFLKGPLQAIDSDVVVDSPNGGDWSYNGIFNERTLRATFVVTGELCIA